MDNLRERLAEYAHEAWSGWMKYLFEKSEDTCDFLIVPPGLRDRWKRQMAAAYKDLPENEKESDRKEADRVIKIVNKCLKDMNKQEL